MLEEIAFGSLKTFLSFWLFEALHACFYKNGAITSLAAQPIKIYLQFQVVEEALESA